MSRLTFSLFTALLFLSGCNGGGPDSAGGSYADEGDYSSLETVEVSAMASQARGKELSAPSPSPTPSGQETVEADTRMLAYEYGASLMVPAQFVHPLLSRHEAACHAAGPSTCQVIASNVHESGEDYVYGTLEIRAHREWLAEFRGGLKEEATDAKGKLTGMSVRAEDLTRTITDTAARLEAQKALRVRLLALLERDTDKVSDLLQIEREIARVQSEIEGAESYLRILRARVSMDRMSLDYQTLPRAVSPQTTQPLVRAFTRFFGELSQSLASLILFLARTIPWLVIGLPILWLLLRFANRFRKKG